MDTVIFRLLLTIVALAPVPFGSVHPWAWNCLALAVGILLTGWALTRRDANNAAARIPVGLDMTAPILIAAVLLFGWLAVQSLLDVPESWRHPLWRDAAAALGRPLQGRISLDPGNGASGMIRLGTYAGIFWLALQFGRNPSRARQAIIVVAIAGTGYALYGMALHILGSRTILGFDKEVYLDDLTSTFINRNNYATYAGLGWLCLLALLFSGLGRWTGAQSSRAEWFLALIKYIEWRGWLYLLGMLLVASALLTSHSRGGLLSTVVGMGVFCLSVRANGSHEKGAARRFGLLALALLLVCFMAGGRIVQERLISTPDNIDSRLAVYSLTAKAIADRPVLGTGLGTFEEAFRLYRTPDIKATFAQAHNSYLETALDIGILGCALILAALVGVALFNLRGIHQRRRDAIYPCLGLSASVLVAVHATMDFSIQIPAIASTYALILGIAFSQSWSSRSKSVW